MGVLNLEVGCPPGWATFFWKFSLSLLFLFQVHHPPASPLLHSCYRPWVDWQWEVHHLHSGFLLDVCQLKHFLPLFFTLHFLLFSNTATLFHIYYTFSISRKALMTLGTSPQTWSTLTATSCGSKIHLKDKKKVHFWAKVMWVMWVQDTFERREKVHF